jgi:exopolysaccharide biosynthesis polyprenyl glycosylphosphotransferase
MTWVSFWKIIKAVTLAIILFLFAIYLFQLQTPSRALLLLFYSLDLTFLVAARLATDRIIVRKRQSEYFYRHLLIIGSRTTARELIKLINLQKDPGFKIVGCIELEPQDVGKTVSHDVKVIGTLEDIREIMLNQVIDEVIITVPLNLIHNSEWYLSFMNTFGVTIRIIPYWYIRKFMNIHAFHSFKLDQFLSEPALIISRTEKNQDALVVKSIIDYSLAGIALLIFSPLFVVIPLLIKLISPGPVFFRQTRSGLDGRTFPLFKFRTMKVGAEESQYTLIEQNEADGPVFKIKKDPRIIPYLGTFLRKFGLDEIPQFINVIRGEMSIVGPRPPTPAEVKKYELWQRRRLSMKPGITCIWQIQPGRNDLSFDEWMNMDMYYIDHWSLWLDFTIIVKTIPAMLLGRGR